MLDVNDFDQIRIGLATADDIEVDGTLSGMPAITLRPGTRPSGCGASWPGSATA